MELEMVWITKFSMLVRKRSNSLSVEQLPTLRQISKTAEFSLQHSASDLRSNLLFKRTSYRSSKLGLWPTSMESSIYSDATIYRLSGKRSPDRSYVALVMLSTDTAKPWLHSAEASNIAPAPRSTVIRLMLEWQMPWFINFSSFVYIISYIRRKSAKE